MFRWLNAGLCVSLASGLVLSAACVRGGESSGDSSGGARAWVEKDPKIMKEVVVLRVDAPDVIEARIAPSCGANLFSLSWAGNELLYLPDTLSLFDGSRYGVPVLYPSPCRIPGGKFSFRGEQFDFGLNRDDTHIHGLVRDAAWEFSPPVARDGAATLSTWIDFKPGSEIYRKFPFEHRLTLTYTLDSTGIKLAFSVSNRDRRDLPFGFGLHPFWNYPGGQSDVWLSAPVAERMELAGLVPTGKLLPVQGTAWDICNPVSVSTLEMDDVFTGMVQDAPAVIEFRKAGLRLSLEASSLFGHLIVYALPSNPFFCVENLTSSPDAHNLYARGFEAASGLNVVPPGAEISGWVKYSLDPLL